MVILKVGGKFISWLNPKQQGQLPLTMLNQK